MCIHKHRTCGLIIKKVDGISYTFLYTRMLRQENGSIETGRKWPPTESILIVQLKKELCGRRNVKLPVKRLASRPRPATN